MRVIENELQVAYDVDDTLVMWSDPTVPGVGKKEFTFAGKTVYLTPHQYHIDLMKMYRDRGYHITVWSANGVKWALHVVEQLKLDVDDVRGKLTKWVDDNTNGNEVLGAHVYCKDITNPSYIFVPRTDELTVYADSIGVLNGR